MAEAAEIELHGGTRHIWIFYQVIAYHLCLGILLLFAPSAASASALYGLDKGLMGFGIYSATLVGWIMIAVALMAALSIVWSHHPWKFGLLLAPQQFVLLLNAYGAVYLVWIRRYAVTDLTPAFRALGFHGRQLRELVTVLGPELSKLTDWKLLLAAQLITIIAALAHSGSCHGISLQDGTMASRTRVVRMADAMKIVWLYVISWGSSASIATATIGVSPSIIIAALTVGSVVAMIGYGRYENRRLRRQARHIERTANHVISGK